MLIMFIFSRSVYVKFDLEKLNKLNMTESSEQKRETKSINIVPSVIITSGLKPHELLESHQMNGCCCFQWKEFLIPPD